MLHASMKFMALAALIAATSPAAAGSPCCACVPGCAVPVGVVTEPFTAPFLIVDQGPVYTGPGIVLVPGYVLVDTAPATYPYVGRDYAYPPYPYYHRRHRHHAPPLRVRW
jgi:hypothetical protein